tara:strand:+ start:99 stop:569 length:471 start_codon:yes stop_codon:yes gene_type:complete
MMNKKGALVLRDMVFMMMIVSAIFVLAGIFVSDMANSYENTNMTEEWGLVDTNTLANSTFYDVGSDVAETGEGLSVDSTGIWSLIEGAGNVLKGIGSALFMVLTAPNTIGDLVSATLIDMGVTSSVASIINYLIVIVLWGVIIFTIASAFLRGPRI